MRGKTCRNIFLLLPNERFLAFILNKRLLTLPPDNNPIHRVFDEFNYGGRTNNSGGDVGDDLDTELDSLRFLGSPVSSAPSLGPEYSSHHNLRCTGVYFVVVRHIGYRDRCVEI